MDLRAAARSGHGGALVNTSLPHQRRRLAREAHWHKVELHRLEIAQGDELAARKGRAQVRVAVISGLLWQRLQARRDERAEALLLVSLGLVDHEGRLA